MFIDAISHSSPLLPPTPRTEGLSRQMYILDCVALIHVLPWEMWWKRLEIMPETMLVSRRLWSL